MKPEKSPFVSQLHAEPVFPMKGGRHPSHANLCLWPLKSNKKARGNQSP